MPTCPGKYPFLTNQRGVVVEWSDTSPPPCSLCGGPVATHQNDVWGALCGVCDAMERSTTDQYTDHHTEYWINLLSHRSPEELEKIHVDGDDREVPDGTS